MKLRFVFNRVLLLFLMIQYQCLWAQNIETINKPYIKTVQLYSYGSQIGFPVLQLNGSDKIELDFDDIDANYKNYYYTYVLCDYNWQPSNLSSFDYIKGFTQNRISNYRYSSIAFTKYTHYQVVLPEQNAIPIRSGNYLLKVFLNGDTAQTVFTKQFVVFEPKASISASVVQPFSSNLFYTHQRVKFTAALKDINSFSAAQQIKTVILQNNRWDLAQRNIPPTYVRGKDLEYNNEGVGVFPAGREWRWLDLRSFSLQSDRVDSGVYNKKTAEFYLKPDIDRSAQRYAYYPDYNGMFNIISFDNINPFWQGDYCNIHFNYSPPENKAYVNKQLYLIGQFTGYALCDKWKMNYNPDWGLYQLSTPLKQGYYNYAYVLLDVNDANSKTMLEGNYWETENSYTILMYYKSLSDRCDQLIGVATINSRTDKPGFSF